MVRDERLVGSIADLHLSASHDCASSRRPEREPRRSAKIGFKMPSPSRRRRQAGLCPSGAIVRASAGGPAGVSRPLETFEALRPWAATAAV